MATILRAEERHLPAIGELWKEFMDFHAARNVYWTRSPDGHRVFSDDLRRMLDDPAVLLLVAVEGDAVIGYAFAKIEAPPPVLKIERRGHIVDVAVTASRRRQGIGAALDARMREWFSEHGIERIQLFVSAQNEESAVFWRARGYVPWLYGLPNQRPDGGESR